MKKPKKKIRQIIRFANGSTFSIASGRDSLRGATTAFFRYALIQYGGSNV